MKAHMGAQMNRKFKGKVPDPMDISQEPSCVEICRQNAAPQIELKPQTQSLCEPVALENVPRATFDTILQEKSGAPD